MISLKKSEELNDLHSMAIDYNNIGQLLKEKGELDRPLQYAKKALEIQTELNNKIGMSIEFNNIGTILQTRGEFDRDSSICKKGH